MNRRISRRSALQSLTGGAAALATVASLPETLSVAAEPAKLKGHIHHSACLWCYGRLLNGENGKPARMTFEEFCAAGAAMGLESIELLGPSQWPAVKKAGLICAMCSSPDNISYGWNRLEHHDDLLPKFEQAIPQVAQYGFPNIITFSGNRRGMDDQQGLENCVKGLKRLMPIAEKYKVLVTLELLNSKVDHKDYMADHTAWGVEVCKRVDSEWLKLLYDIYHMQIMEGDVIRTITDDHQFIGHFHTGGVPGRGEIDETQELNYSAVMKAIVATGYKGFVSQEFVPKGADPLESLRQAIRICDV